MNDIVELCDKLENCRISRNCDANGVICARKLVQDYIGEDHNKLLQLKADVMRHKDTENEHEIILSSLISVMALFVTIMGFLDKEIVVAFGTFVVIVIVTLNVVKEINSRKLNARQKWVRYIEIVLNDIEHDK